MSSDTDMENEEELRLDVHKLYQNKMSRQRE